MLQQMSPNQGLPDIIRVKALKGFRGLADGTFGIVNPGDVVDVPRELAFELRAANKAVAVTDERKRVEPAVVAQQRLARKRAVDPVNAQLAGLTSAVEALTGAVQVLLKNAEKSGKKEA